MTNTKRGARSSDGRSTQRKRTTNNSKSTRPQRSSGSSRYSRQGGHNTRRRSGGGRKQSTEIHPSRFINKAVTTTETVEHFTPEHTFKDFALSEELKSAVSKRGYDQPTPIQDKVIAHIIEGLDVVGLANTGTGKTAAFLLPLINKVLANRKEQVLILAPTRELAIQIEEEFRAFTKNMRMYSVVCVGGVNIGQQLRALKRPYNFIIGTPGRIMDLMDRKALKLDGTQTIVLDEADRMLDMGFINDMRFVMERMPKKRHTLFFSATMSPDIEALIGDFLNEPVRISVKTQDTSKNVDQDVVKVRGLNKVDILNDLLLNKKEFTKVLVFGRTKYGVEKLSKMLNKRGVKSESIHGNKTHPQRQRALKNFKQGSAQVLVATDVAARGLDIDKVTHVINYDVPATYDDYVHRIGRTGRGKQTGKAITFVE